MKLNSYINISKNNFHISHKSQKIKKESIIRIINHKCSVSLHNLVILAVRGLLPLLDCVPRHVGGGWIAGQLQYQGAQGEREDCGWSGTGMGNWLGSGVGHRLGTGVGN